MTYVLPTRYQLCPTTPEDYTSLASAVTYHWMTPLMNLALKRSLLPSDLWRLRSINDTRILFANFRKMRKKASGRPQRLVLRLVIANARDAILDATYTVCSVVLNYGSVYLMKQILDEISKAALEDGTEQPEGWTHRQRAFVLALASLLLTVIMFIFNLLNFHHARQVGLRIRSVAVAELFEKALKRRSTAGAVAQSAPASSQKDAGKEVDAPVAATDEPEANVADADEADERATKTADRTKTAADLQKSEKDSKKDTNEEPADAGKVINLMSADVNVLLRMGCDLHQLYGSPVETVVATVFLYNLLGWSALAGFSILIFSAPINYLAGRASVRAQRAWREKVDARMNLVTELLGAARFVKLQGVVSRWQERVLEARHAEIKALLWVRYNTIAFTVIFIGMPILVTIATFTCFVKVQGEELTVPIAFTALSLFTMLQRPLTTIPQFAMGALNAWVSVQRLEAFLKEDEVDDFVSALAGKPDQTVEDITSHSAPQENLSQAHSAEPIEFVGATFTWSKPDEKDDDTTSSGSTSATVSQPRGMLRDVTISFPPAKLSIIAGPTGSGKSTLLHAILGELRRIKGSAKVPKWVGPESARRSGFSYAPQSPWIEGGKSIKQNILFASPFDKARYDQVLHACALIDDLASLEAGDETRVSSTTLSGGQQARIGLARALYAPSHTVLLDDPLAAVDAHVQRHIVEHAIAGPLGQGRRIILATHHFSIVSRYASYLVYLKEGTVNLQGLLEDLRQQGLLTGPLAEAATQHHRGEGSSTASSSGTPAEPSPETSEKDKKDTKDGEGAPVRLLYDLEKRREGAVNWSMYRVYLGVSSPLLWFLVLLLTLSVRFADFGQQFWLKIWTEADDSQGDSKHFWHRLPSPRDHQDFYLAIYGLLGAAQILVGSGRTIIVWLATLRASQKLCVRMLKSVLGARLRFFDTNPLGRILQRFNNDVDVMDSQLPMSLLNFLLLVPLVVGNLIVCGAVVPWFLVPSAVFFVWGPYYVKGFLASTRDMQRIESTSTSPMYSVFASSMAGIATIRAFGVERARMDEMLSIIDVTSAQWWAICTIEVWLSFRNQIAGGLAVFLITVLALQGTVSAGSVGIVMSAAQKVTAFSYFLTQSWKQLSNNFNSIERIQEFIDLPPESSEGEECRQPPAAWPTSSGDVQIENLRVAYDKDLPDVLQDVTLDIPPCAKIGIVGRTGSGKTTLASALFRAVEAKTGRIIIDGIDIASLDVDTLRRRICIVPQSPVLFSGTIRKNLDPFDERTDEECIWALRRVRIAVTATASKKVKSTRSNGHSDGFTPIMTTTLDSPVATGGSNFSAGEAQLLSLARALLRDARIVVLDEATSSTDGEMDAAIQVAVREMRQSIVITVAHRLQTVLDYDRVCVLSQGKVLEWDSPKELLRKEGGEFRRMCETSGISLEHATTV